MERENISTLVKRLLRESGMIGKIIAVNVGFFLFFLILNVFEKLFGIPLLTLRVKYYFVAPGDPSELLYRPWAIITQLFTHGDFIHLLFNMVVFYFVAQIFVRFFGERRILTTYLLGGVFAYVFHVVAYYVFPGLTVTGAPPITGASASIMAVFIAAAVYQPGFKVNLFGVFPVSLVILGALYVISDLTGLGSNDNVAHFAHLGGAVFGGLSVRNFSSNTNFMNRFDRWFYNIKWPNFSFKRKPKMKAYKNPGANARKMTDDEYNAAKTAHQKKIDAILEKISKKGYDGLSKAEKELLFNESKRKK
jgi:membrane associated rhomboid family serine protease